MPPSATHASTLQQRSSEMTSSNQHNKRRGNQWAAPAIGEAGVAADAITPGLESVDPDQGGSRSDARLFGGHLAGKDK